MITIKEYAKSVGKTQQAVYKQLTSKKNKVRLEGHLIKENGTTYLDDEAVKILNESRQTTVVLIEQEKDEEIERLKEENRNLLLKIASQADKIAELSEWKSDHAVMIAEANQNKLLLEEKIKQFDELKANNQAIHEELSITKVELEKEKHKSWWTKLRGK
jgi:shikimate kinase